MCRVPSSPSSHSSADPAHTSSASATPTPLLPCGWGGESALYWKVPSPPHPGPPAAVSVPQLSEFVVKAEFFNKVIFPEATRANGAVRRSPALRESLHTPHTLAVPPNPLPSTAHTLRALQ